MALPQEIWIQDIVETLFAGNPHMARGVDHSEFVNFKTVHVPNEAGVPNVEKNRATLPAQVQTIGEKDLTYNINSFTTDPIYIKLRDELETSYNKRMSQTRRLRQQLNVEVGFDTIHSWASDKSAHKFSTSGSSSSDAPLAPSATGSRKLLTLDDLAKVAELFDNQDVPAEDRYMMLPPGMYYNLFKISDLKDQAIIGQQTLPEGVITTIFGFNIMVRSKTPVYDSSQNLKDIGAAGASGDHLAVIAWQRDAVSRALGDIIPYENENDPVYYGHILSAQLDHGAKIIRDGEEGTAAIVQTT